MPSDIECVFTPKVDPSVYTVSIANDIMLSLTLNEGKKCVIPALGVRLGMIMIGACGNLKVHNAQSLGTKS